MRRSNLSKQEVASRCKHNTAHVLTLFDNPEPNPTLRLYLDVVHAAGARFSGVRENTPAAFIERLVELRNREKISNVALAQTSGISRPQLSTLLNDRDPNPLLSTVDRIVTAIGVEAELELIAFTTQTVRLAIAAGAETLHEAEAAEEAVRTSRRHLHVVQTEPPSAGQAEALRKLREAEARVEAAEARLQAALQEVAALEARCLSLHEANVALEKQNAEAEARLRQIQAEPRWTGRKIAGVCVASFMAGAAVAVAVNHLRKA